MASSKKKGLTKLSPERSPKNDKPYLETDFTPGLIEAVCGIVKTSLEPFVTSLLQREVDRIVVQLKETFDSRIRDLEITCRELTHSLEFQRSEFEDRLDQMESKLSSFRN